MWDKTYERSKIYIPSPNVVVDLVVLLVVGLFVVVGVVGFLVVVVGFLVVVVDLLVVVVGLIVVVRCSEQE